MRGTHWRGFKGGSPGIHFEQLTQVDLGRDSPNVGRPTRWLCSMQGMEDAAELG